MGTHGLALYFPFRVTVVHLVNFDRVQAPYYLVAQRSHIVSFPPCGQCLPELFHEAWEQEACGREHLQLISRLYVSRLRVAA